LGRPKTKATKLPVHAPVKGKGMATKNNKANSLNLSTFTLCFFLVLSKSQLKNLSKSLKRLLRKFEIFPKNKRRKTTGKILPATAVKNKGIKGRLYTNIPKGIEPLNSETGNIERKKI